MDCSKIRNTVRRNDRIGAVGIAEYMLSAFLPSVSYADVFKYVNLAEYMKVYPLFSKYHNLDLF